MKATQRHAHPTKVTIKNKHLKSVAPLILDTILFIILVVSVLLITPFLYLWTILSHFIQKLLGNRFIFCAVLSFLFLFLATPTHAAWGMCTYTSPYVTFTYQCWVQDPILSPTPNPTPTTTPTITPTTPTVSQPTPTGVVSSRLIQLGAYVGDGFSNMNNVNTFQNLVGKKLKVVLFYQAWGVSDDTKNFQPTWMNNIRNNGSTAMITWEPWNYTAGAWQWNYNLKNIAQGNHDTYIRKFARDSKTWGYDYYLRSMHEMNGNWYPWAAGVNGNTSQDYINAWKHIKDIFNQEGATNAKFVWCPNIVYSGSTNLASLYPGDNYVDLLCMDGYNWGNTNGGWQSFETLFRTTYNQLTALSNKEIFIGEIASAEQGGNKSNWISDAYGPAIDSMPKIMGINWFNANKEKDWRVNSTQNSLNNFKSAIQNAKY